MALIKGYLPTGRIVLTIREVSSIGSEASRQGDLSRSSHPCTIFQERQLKEQGTRMKNLENENDELKDSWACQRDKMERLWGTGGSEQEYLRQQVEALKKENTRLRDETIDEREQEIEVSRKNQEIEGKNQELLKVRCWLWFLDSGRWWKGQISWWLRPARNRVVQNSGGGSDLRSPEVLPTCFFRNDLPRLHKVVTKATQENSRLKSMMATASPPSFSYDQHKNFINAASMAWDAATFPAALGAPSSSCGPSASCIESLYNDLGVPFESYQGVPFE